ncbi:MAG: hypothetical protein J6H18_05800, partial [Lachnospiraceae bacterium]|nr:hypothetical protein [Lachnospiraceae bacterium]
AHALLALLYHSEGKYARAEKELRTALRADVGNTFCLHMAKEMAEDIRTPQVKRRRSLREAGALLGSKADEKTEKIRMSLEGRPAFWLKILLIAGILLSVAAGILIPTLKRRQSRIVSEAVARYSVELESARRDLDLSLELREAYGIFLEMSRLDPVKEEELDRLHRLFDSLENRYYQDELYTGLYNSWKEYLPVLDREAESRAAATTSPRRPIRGQEEE